MLLFITMTVFLLLFFFALMDDAASAVFRARAEDATFMEPLLFIQVTLWFPLFGTVSVLLGISCLKFIIFTNGFYLLHIDLCSFL